MSVEFTEPDVGAAAPYANDLELIADLLAHLDRRFHALIAAARAHDVPQHALKRLNLREGDVTRSVGGDQAAVDEPSFALGSLLDAATARLPHDGAPALRLLQLRDRFHLTPFEIECVLVCVAGDIDRKYEQIFAYLNDDIGQKQPSPDLLIRLLAPKSLRPQLLGMLAQDARLLRCGILTSVGDRNNPLLRLSDGVARFLLSRGGVDASLSRVWCLDEHPPVARELWAALPQTEEFPLLLQSHLAEVRNGPLIVMLHGREGSGRRYVAEYACDRLGYACLSLDARAIRRSANLEATLVAALRDALLLGAPLLLTHFDDWFDESERGGELRSMLERLVEELGWVLLIAVTDATPLRRWFRTARIVEIAFADPSVAERARAWRHLLTGGAEPGALEASATAESLASKYRLSLGEIAEAMYRAEGAHTSAMTDEEWASLLHRRAAIVAAPRLQALARQVTPAYGFEDLVLPEAKTELLRDVVRRVRHRRQVLEQWSFDTVLSRGRGLVALFFGPSGTGKTMAAEVIARELQMDLYRVDLAGVVSKYIGETEKNLRSLFDEADRSDAILFFDEADALFGKRSEVKDAHDRYANIEINYLLQRIESFEGIAILATNMSHHLDEAFMRRIHVTVEFTAPRADERLHIWERSFPAGAPLEPGSDLAFLARRFELSGGAIRNVALGAAYLAADQDGVIGMPQLVSALHRELLKSGRRVQSADFGSYAAYLPAQVRAASPLAQ